MKAQILIVEDDPGLSAFTRNLLTNHGFQVTAVKTAEAALDYIQSRMPDLVIVDVNLPGLSGLRLCDILKKENRTASLPVIILTMLGSQPDKIRGLETGADDYLVKPYSHRELVLRVEALLRRAHHGGSPAKRLQIKELIMDLERRQVFIKGKTVFLRRKEYELLSLFMQHPGRLLTQTFITNALWKNEMIVTSNTLNVHMRNLRKKLGIYRNLIQTFIGEGYQLTDAERP